MKRSAVTLASALILSAAMSTAYAADEKTGLYIAASGGSTSFEDHERITSNLNNILGSPATRTKDNDVGFSGSLGYRLGKVLAVEASYVNSGEWLSHHDLISTSVSVVSQHASVSMLAHGQISKDVGIYGRLGVAHWELETTITTAGVPATDKTSGNDLVYGAGLSYALSERLDLTADYLRIKMRVPRGNIPIAHFLFGVRYGFY